MTFGSTRTSRNHAGSVAFAHDSVRTAGYFRYHLRAETLDGLVEGAMAGSACEISATGGPSRLVRANLENLIMPDVPTVELNVDPDGALVTLEAAIWYVCFVPGLDKQWWHRFVNQRHKHVFAMRPAGPGMWTLFEPWWHRLLTATITSVQAKRFLLWGALGDVLMVRESIPGHGSQIRGWMDCAGLVSYLLGRSYWVWSPHGLYKLLLREPHVCRVDVSALLEFDAAKLEAGSPHIAVCNKCAPGAPPPLGAVKPFCINCGRDLCGSLSFEKRSAPRAPHANP